MVAERTIVGDVCSGHQIVAVPDNRGLVRMHRPVDRDEFTQGVFGANDDQAGLFRAANVLRLPADDGAFANGISRSKSSAILENGVPSHLTFIPDDNVVFHDGERTDTHALTDLRLWTDNRQRVDIHGDSLAGWGGKFGGRS
jgi:hypothetical protein